MASLVPVLGLTVAVTFLLRDEMLRSAEAEIGGVSKGVLSSLEGKLKSGLRLTSALSRSSSIATGNYKAFSSEARAVIASDPDVAWILLTDIKRGVFRFHSELTETPGTPVPAGPTTMRDVSDVVRDSRAVLFNLRIPRASSRIPVATIPIRIRVRGPADEALMLTVMLKAQGFENLLRPKGVSKDWTLRVLDAKDQLVASNTNSPESIGRVITHPEAACDGTPVFRLIGASPPGVPVDPSTPAESRYETRICSPEFGWSILIDVPKRIQDAESLRVLALILIAGLLAASVSFAVALSLARRLQAQQKMREEIEAARRANQLKNEFLANVSHELRTPLNAILGHAQLLGTTASDDATAEVEEHDHVGKIMRAGWYLRELIDDVIDMSRIESGTYEMETTAVDLDSTIEHCLTQMSKMAASANVNILPVKRTGSANLAMADPKRLREVMLNLIGNAIKYNVAGGTVEVSITREANDRIRIAITDSGRGISAKDMERIFQPFERFRHTGDAIEGAGIGLSMSKRLLKLMGGELSARSTEGSGSEFVVSLRAATPAGESEAAASQGKSQIPPAQGVSGKMPAREICVLYVEDTLTNFEIVRIYFEKQPGFRIRHAEAGADGLEQARMIKPDLILLDMGLPDMNGMEVKTRLAEHPLTRDIPVIALTAVALESEIERARSAGFADYVTKPVRLPHLREIILRLLDEREPANDPFPKKT